MGMTHICLGMETSPECRGHLKDIDLAARSLLRLLNDILDFSETENGMRETESGNFQLDEVMKTLFRRFAPQARKKGISMKFRAGEGLPFSLNGDRTRLGQTLDKLTDNALKFTESGGIMIRAEVDEEGLSDPEQVLLRFSIRDSGIGMDMAETDTLFDPFVQGDGSKTRKFGGTGLGLAMGRQQVENMGGRIWAESELGKGSTFFFTIPFRVQAKQRGPSALPRDIPAVKSENRMPADSRSTEPASFAPEDMANLNPILKKLLELIRFGDSETKDYLASVGAELRKIASEEEVSRLENEIEDHEFEEAEDILLEIMKRLGWPPEKSEEPNGRNGHGP